MLHIFDCGLVTWGRYGILVWNIGGDRRHTPTIVPPTPKYITQSPPKILLMKYQQNYRKVRGEVSLGENISHSRHTLTTVTTHPLPPNTIPVTMKKTFEIFSPKLPSVTQNGRRPDTKRVLHNSQRNTEEVYLVSCHQPSGDYRPFANYQLSRDYRLFANCEPVGESQPFCDYRLSHCRSDLTSPWWPWWADWWIKPDLTRICCVHPPEILWKRLGIFVGPAIPKVGPS